MLQFKRLHIVHMQLFPVYSQVHSSVTFKLILIELSDYILAHKNKIAALVSLKIYVIRISIKINIQIM